MNKLWFVNIYCNKYLDFPEKVKQAVNRGEKTYVLRTQNLIFNRNNLRELLINENFSGTLLKINNVEQINISEITYKISEELQKIKNRKFYHARPRLQEIFINGLPSGLFVKAFADVKIFLPPNQLKENRFLSLNQDINKQFIILPYYRLPKILFKIDFEVVKENV